MANLSESDPLFLTTGEVAEMLDAHPSSVKRWSGRQELAYVTTAGGHRRFTVDAVRTFSEASGVPFAFAVLEEDLEPYLKALRAPASGLDAQVHDLLFGWLSAGMTGRLEWSLSHLHRTRYTLGGLFDRIVMPLLTRIGGAWEHGELSVAHEHFMSQQLFEGLYRLRPQVGAHGGTRPIAICAGAENTNHVFGLMMSRLILEHLGWAVIYLGAAVPNEDLGAFILERETQMVVISFSYPQSVNDVQRTLRTLATLAQVKRFSLALGGKPAEKAVLPAALSHGEIFQSMAAFETWALASKLGLAGGS